MAQMKACNFLDPHQITYWILNQNFWGQIGKKSDMAFLKDKVKQIKAINHNSKTTINQENHQFEITLLNSSTGGTTSRIKISNDDLWTLSLLD